MKLEKEIEEKEIFLFWYEELDKKIIDVSRPYFFFNEELFVYVCNSLWLHYINLHKHEIINKLNKKRKLIKNIRLKIGDIGKEDEKREV